MAAEPPVSCRDEQLLGEIETRIVGMQHYEATVALGEPVNLDREPNNPHDSQAIRVENSRSESVGHLPARIASWLAPLIDSGRVRLDAYVPRAAQIRRRSTIPVTVTVFLTAQGKRLLKPREVRTREDALHELLLRAYRDAQEYPNAELILEVSRALHPLAKQELLPETRLLLAMLPAVAREVRTNQAFGAMARLQSLLAHVRIGEPLSHRSVTVFPLSWDASQEPPYVLLGPAIEGQAAVVEEMDENGDVPHLCVTSMCDQPILIPEGEILVGAKQNRVVNVTVLVASRTRFTLPVSCVERGRWEYRSRHFRSEYAAPPSLRSKKLRAVQRSRAERQEVRSDQGEVWDEVDACLCSMGVESETASLTDGYAAAEKKLREFRKRLQLPEGTAGILVAHAGWVVGMDLFDTPATFSALRQRLTDAYFLDALRDRRRAGKMDPRQAREFIDQIAAGARPRVPALGQGEELEITGDGIVGAALLFSGRVCHLAAFSEST